LEVGRTRKSGIAATTVEVVVRGEAAGAAPLVRVPPSDAPLTAHEHGHGHSHEHEHEHTHEGEWERGGVGEWESGRTFDGVAALAAALAEEFGPLPGFTVRAVGYGAGKKDFPFPNLLRVFVGETGTEPREAAEVVLLEANIDDQSPQLYESVMEALFAAGALD